MPYMNEEMVKTLISNGYRSDTDEYREQVDAGNTHEVRILGLIDDNHHGTDDTRRVITFIIPMQRAWFPVEDMKVPDDTEIEDDWFVLVEDRLDGRGWLVSAYEQSHHE
jgi:hypothetical protein